MWRKIMTEEEAKMNAYLRPWKLLSNQFIVIWMLKKKDASGTVYHIDRWAPFENEIEANEHYNDLLEREDVYSASVVIPIRSTDYDCMDALNISGSEVYMCEREQG
jgi:hypothetical protein